MSQAAWPPFGPVKLECATPPATDRRPERDTARRSLPLPLLLFVRQSTHRKSIYDFLLCMAGSCQGSLNNSVPFFHSFFSPSPLSRSSLASHLLVSGPFAAYSKQPPHIPATSGPPLKLHHPAWLPRGPCRACTSHLGRDNLNTTQHILHTAELPVLNMSATRFVRRTLQRRDDDDDDDRTESWGLDDDDNDEGYWWYSDVGDAARIHRAQRFAC